MKTMDYISILAGGSCKFNCSFCIGNNIRKNVTPFYSSKWRSFLECYADQTLLLSVSGDTSDPSLINATRNMPLIAKEFNPNIKVSVHTKSLELIDMEGFDNYDKIVISIDEDFFNLTTRYMLLFLQENQKRMRFSIVLTSYNFGYFIENDGIIEKLIQMFPNIQITLRPEVSEADHIVNCISGLGTWINKNNGSQVLEENSNIWLWNYKKTNPKIDALYLFSDGNIKNNDRWDEIQNDRI